MFIGILQTFAVAIDSSLLDLFRALGIAVDRASPFYELYSIKVATAAPIVPYLLLVLMLIVRPRASSARATYEERHDARGTASRRSRGARQGREQLQAWVATAAILALLPHVPGLHSDFGHSMLSQMGIARVFALSFNMLLGQTGLLSFGHAVYFGLGGYAASI
jgi:hypothetical protein